MRLRKAPSHRTGNSGFTLVELLVYVSVASVVMAAAAHTVLSSIRSSTNLELERRGLETWARITQFIESEIANGSEILYDREYELCEDSSGDQQSLDPTKVVLTIAVPTSKNTAWNSSNTSVYDRNNNQLLVHYGLRKTNGYFALLRCGPPYDEVTGELKADADRAYETMIHPRAVLELLTAYTNRVTYSINFLTPPSTSGGAQPIFTQARRATASTGQQLIDDPSP